MNDITIRFIAIYDDLVNAKIVKNQTDFCRKMGISPSVFTEIRNNRSQVGTKVLQKLVKEFDVDANYLLKGTYSLNRPDQIVSDIKTGYKNCEVCPFKIFSERYERDIQRYEKEIERLTHTIDELKSSYNTKTKSISA